MAEKSKTIKVSLTYENGKHRYEPKISRDGRNWKPLESERYAHNEQSQTATLIIGGAADPRVHPSQSMELYRRMKMNGHPAVRLVQYPGEGHGNGRQPGRIDVLYRILDWYDWYVKEAKPLTGTMPPLDLSGKYGLELPK